MAIKSIGSHTDSTQVTGEGDTVASRLVHSMVKDLLPLLLQYPRQLQRLEGYAFNYFAQPPLNKEQLQLEKQGIIRALRRLVPKQEQENICFLMDTLEGIQITVSFHYLSSPLALQAFFDREKHNLHEQVFLKEG